MFKPSCFFHLPHSSPYGKHVKVTAFKKPYNTIILILIIKLTYIIVLSASKINKAVHTSTNQPSTYMYTCITVHLINRCFIFFITIKASEDFFLSKIVLRCRIVFIFQRFFFPHVIATYRQLLTHKNIQCIF